MGSMSLWHWIVVIAVVALLFGGRGKISDLMGDFAKGIKSFKKGMSEDDTAAADPAKNEPVKSIQGQSAAAGSSAAATPASPDLAARAQTERRVEGSMS